MTTQPVRAAAATVADRLAAVLQGRLTMAQDPRPPAGVPSDLATSCWMVEHAAHDQVMRRRRENYQHWLAGVQGLQGVQPLFPELPDGVVPYAFPLLTDAGGLVFHALKLAGIPIWRWEDVAKTECPVSLDFRLRLLQLPCHQDLSREEIDWMLRVLHGVVPGLLV